jgi:hypothetical protein
MQLRLGADSDDDLPPLIADSSDDEYSSSSPIASSSGHLSLESQGRSASVLFDPVLLWTDNSRSKLDENDQKQQPLSDPMRATLLDFPILIPAQPTQATIATATSQLAMLANNGRVQVMETVPPMRSPSCLRVFPIQIPPQPCELSTTITATTLSSEMQLNKALQVIHLL